jgi:TfoX/Sxy family transcriptional regulator of competence genes
MAYDEDVANRLRAALARALGPADEIEERRMFGGIGQLVNGHMCVGVHGAELIVHVRAETNDECLSLPHARPMDFTGRPMRGWLYVSPAGYRAEADLDAWVSRALDFVHTSGPKKPGTSSMKPKKPPAAAKRPSPSAKTPSPAKPTRALPAKAKTASPAKAKPAAR